jgi:hypothetical protein
VSVVVCEATRVPHPESETCDERVEVKCAWWALCPEAATTFRPHPILGAVPICGSCDAKVEALS